MTDFQAAHDQLEQEIKQYNIRTSEYSVRNTDCPGTPASQEQLTPFGLSATICKQQ